MKMRILDSDSPPNCGGEHSYQFGDVSLMMEDDSYRTLEDNHCIADSSTPIALPPPSDVVFSGDYSQFGCTDYVEEGREDLSLSDWLSQKIKPIKAGTGLLNLGNTCFVNSVLQCLMHTVPLLSGIFSSGHFPHSNRINSDFCILCDLKGLVEVSLASTNRPVRPWKFVFNLNYFSSYFRRYQQEDAHEFFQCFLEKLESCFDSNVKDSACSQSENLVKRVFGGSIVSKLKCCSCGYTSDSCEPSIDLSLEIEDANSLEMALHSFTSLETDIKFTCDKCQEEVCMEKQLCLNQNPLVAVFHLKRFRNDGYFSEKIDKHVAFPTVIDLQPFSVSGSNTNAEHKYELYAILVHSGMTNTSGHYFSFVRLSPNMWCKFDDAEVELVDENTLLSQEAYVLFYTKEGTPWFSCFTETLKLVSDHEKCNTSPKSVFDNDSVMSASPEQENRSADRNDGEIGGQNNEDKEKADDKSSVSVAPPQLASEIKKEDSPNCERNMESDNTFEAAFVRSSSPEIYRDDDPSDTRISFVGDGLKLAKRLSCKRQLEREMDDLESEQAMTLVKKRIPGARGKQLISALEECGNLNRTKKNRSRKGLNVPFPKCLRYYR